MSNSISNKKVLINLGGTYEPIDPIRGISNKSSGKMGLALAKEAYIRGADLTLIAAKCDVEIPSIFNTINVQTSSEMNDCIKSLIKDFDVFIATAAISDFEPIKMQSHKINSSLNLSLEFKPVEKIIRQIKNISPDVFLVGFKAQYDISENDLIDCANKQIEVAGSNLVVANDLSHEGCGFGSDENEVILVRDNGTYEKIELSSKTKLAEIIFDDIENSL
ncbi:phosphopantothenoylcysteine synthase [Methanobrevibacter sp. 87.7]|uniref:phosphopantothenoylcysteine decarboxylase domain-containing protein n=1 Tax=Methanobrevibacter sp. 87.7 TaxID=387957 RepID=UPI000B50B9F7|nr:phosphopantothenoylcysteine decarboxylase [Methanobrevibacter sp. 87.7]OWT32461.1 phosphopantothenoylcysteine synthase [Methanobrevibacter sp. 87.7]